MKIFIISISLSIVFWVLTPFLWRNMGGSFIYGNTVVYKGKELFESKKGCSVAVIGEDLEEVRQVCLISGKTVIRIWINGIEKNHTI